MAGSFPIRFRTQKASRRLSGRPGWPSIGGSISEQSKGLAARNGPRLTAPYSDVPNDSEPERQVARGQLSLRTFCGSSLAHQAIKGAPLSGGRLSLFGYSTRMAFSTASRATS